MKQTLDEKKILEVLREHPIFQELFRSDEEKQKLKEDRMRASQEIERFTKEKAEKIPFLKAEVEKAEKDANEAKQVFMSKKGLIGKARYKIAETKQGLDGEIKRLKKFLIETAPPELIERKKQLEREIDIMRITPVQSGLISHAPDENLVRHSSGFSNYEDIQAEIKRIQEEIKKIDYEILNPNEYVETEVK